MKKNNRISLIIVSVLFLSAGTALILKNFNENIVFFYTPSQLLEKKSIAGKIIRVGGLVEDGSIKRELTNTKTTFTITDNKASLIITYTGLLPNLFREGQGMVAKGKLLSGGTFLADELLAKHDENYMPKEVADAIKKTGQWREQ